LRSLEAAYDGAAKTHCSCNKIRMSGRVRLKSDDCLDEELPSLLEIVFKYLGVNLGVVCDEDAITRQLDLREGIVIPNEICDS
jgi:Zyg-11 protein homolog